MRVFCKSSIFALNVSSEAYISFDSTNSIIGYARCLSRHRPTYMRVTYIYTYIYISCIERERERERDLVTRVLFFQSERETNETDCAKQNTSTTSGLSCTTLDHLPIQRVTRPQYGRDENKHTHAQRHAISECLKRDDPKTNLRGEIPTLRLTTRAIAHSLFTRE